MSERQGHFGVLAELGAGEGHSSRSRQDSPSGIFAAIDGSNHRRYLSPVEITILGGAAIVSAIGATAVHGRVHPKYVIGGIWNVARASVSKDYRERLKEMDRKQEEEWERRMSSG